MLTSTRVDSIDDLGADGVIVTVSDKDGKTEELEADKVLQAIGFAPRVEGYGLETHRRAADRARRDRDRRAVRTNVPHIYAIGDVTAKLMLAHAAEAQGVVAAETIAGAETMELRLPDDAARDLLPAAGRQLRLHRGSRPATRATTSRSPSSRSPPTARRTAWATPSGFVKLIATPSTASCSAGTSSGPT